jgi:hypothetical protein
MSIFSSIDGYDKEAEYRLINQRFIPAVGPDGKGHCTIVELLPRREYEKEYNGQRLLCFDELMNIIYTMCPGYIGKITDEQFKFIVERELEEHNVGVVIYPMKLFSDIGEFITYKDTPFYIIPHGMMSHLAEQLFLYILKDSEVIW